MLPQLDFHEGFQWNVKNLTPLAEHIKDHSSSDDEEIIKSHEGRKRTKKKKSNEDERALEEKLSEVNTFDPSSPNYTELGTLQECDRLVMTYPNSSKAWLLYMTFHLKQAEIDKARNVAEKALKLICFREEKEKYNIWVALMNLENLYGTKESLMSIFQRALSYNEPKCVYSHLLELYLASGKTEEAELLLEVMVKKYKTDKDVWIKCGLFHMERGKQEAAHKLMQRALKCVHAKYYADILAKFALMECKYASTEKGLEMFQNIALNYPKRKDLILMYLNVLQNTGNNQEYERVASVFKTKIN